MDHAPCSDGLWESLVAPIDHGSRKGITRRPFQLRPARPRQCLTTPEGHTLHFAYLREEDPYGQEDFWIEVTDPAGAVTTVLHDCNVVQSVVDPLGHRTTYIWDERREARGCRRSSMPTIIAPRSATRCWPTEPGSLGIERPEIGTFQFGYDGDSRCHSLKTTTAIPRSELGRRPQPHQRVGCGERTVHGALQCLPSNPGDDRSSGPPHHAELRQQREHSVARE